MAASHPPHTAPDNDTEAIKGLLCRIDVALAGQNYDMLVESLAALRPLLQSGQMAEADSYAALLQVVIAENLNACELLHIQTRIDYLIQALRSAFMTINDKVS